MGKFKLSAHARQLMDYRILPEGVVLSILERPDKKFKQNSLMVYQSRIDYDYGKRYLFRVFVDEGLTPAEVITVYKKLL